MKENPNQTYHGSLFGLSQAKVSECDYFLSPILEQSLIEMGYMPRLGDSYMLEAKESEYLLIDVTERRVSRRCDQDAHREEYSGTKKLHRINLAITDQHK